MFDDIIKPGMVLFIITAVASLLLGVANVMTAPIIEKNDLIARNKAMAEVLTGVKDNKFSDKIETDAQTGVVAYNIGYAGEDVYGYVFSVKAKGYGGEIDMMVGVNADGTVEGVRIINHDETPGLGANAGKEKFTGQFIGKKGNIKVTKSASPKENEIQAITSATITSKAVTEGVNLAVEYLNNSIKGGAVQ